MVLSACGGSANTTHEKTKAVPIVFSESGAGPVRIYSTVDENDWVDITYNASENSWSCASNYGDGKSVCMSQVGSTINFFWGTEKVGTADSNVPGEFTPLDGWEDHAKG